MVEKDTIIWYNNIGIVYSPQIKCFWRTKMYTAIKNYCNNGNNNGLFLLDMPTGYGKTYSVLKYIYEASLDESNSKRRFFFITTLKKNLPIEELKKWFTEAGQLDKFNEKFLFIDANVDCVIDGLTSEIINEIPSEIKKTDEYKSFVQDVRFLQEQKNVNKAELRGFIGSIKDNLRSKSEPNFRRLLQTMLAKEFSTVNKRIYAIKTNKRWQWLGKLYPAVFTHDKQIIFMSMDKFLTRNATIVEPSYMFYNTDIIDNAAIFIDEFDATKETLLKNIIQNGLRDKIDYIELFKDIYSALHTNEFPTVLTTPSKQRKESKYKDQTLQSVIDGIREKADAIYENYTLQFSHRTSTDVADNTKNFLFQDHQFHSILDGNNSYITTVSDTKNRINAIRFSKNKPNAEKNNIQVMLGKLRGFIKYFQIGINILAINYMQCKAERKQNGDDEFTMESAIRSVLAEFRLNSIYIDYITSQILIASHKVKGNIENSDFDLSFYENGFRFYSFEDDVVHDMQSKIMMCSFQTTPEKILLRFCEKAKVIGISATATVPTIIGNYGLDYLKSKMQTAFLLPSEADKTRLRSDFSNSLCGYDNVSINVGLLGGDVRDNYSASAWKIVFDSDEISEMIFDRIERELPDIKDNYYKERYIRIALAYKQFVMHNDIQSFLCVLTKHPRKGDKYLNKDVLDEIFKYIIAENNASTSVNSSVYQLDGDEYDIKKDKITRKLSEGQKLFIISVYQTIGAGQNLQYKIPRELEKEVIKINDRPSRGEKDFDAIYLDKPTHLLVNLGNNLSEEEFVKYLYHTEFFQETSELSMYDAFQHIKRAFRCYIKGNAYQLPHAQSVNNSKSVVLLSTRTIIQAIGRICRTNQKRKNIYVFADNRIAENIDLSILNDRLLNKEFIALLDKIREQSNAQIAEGSYENRAALLSVRANKFINNMLREDWTDDRIEKWQQLRELVLTAPTMSEAEVSKNFVAKNFYVKLPAKNNHLFYKQEEDYNNIQIGFTKNKELNLEVSAVAAKLNILMSIPKLKYFFVKKDWATHFEKNDYIMSPTLFNNIYKGALGEVVGRYLFWWVLNLKMEEISEPELFELFDYKVCNLPIYVDFKNWHETTVFNDEEMLNKIEDKANKCGCKCVIIVNIVSEKEWKTHRIERNGLTIVEIPSLLTGNASLNHNKAAWNEIRRCINECSD